MSCKKGFLTEKSFLPFAKWSYSILASGLLPCRRFRNIYVQGEMCSLSLPPCRWSLLHKKLQQNQYLIGKFFIIQ